MAKIYTSERSPTFGLEQGYCIGDQRGGSLGEDDIRGLGAVCTGYIGRERVGADTQDQRYEGVNCKGADNILHVGQCLGDAIDVRAALGLVKGYNKRISVLM